MHLFIFVVHYHFHLYCSSYTSKGNLKYLDVSLANFQIPTRTFVARVSIYKFFFFFFFFFGVCYNCVFGSKRRERDDSSQWEQF
jgi:hypothetical protein